MRPQHRRHILPLIGTGLVLGGCRRGHADGHRHRPGQPPAITFSHGVVVDQQRPGFEPDVKVAPNGAIYSSVPFGFSTTSSYVWSSHDNGSTYQLTPGNVPPQGKPTTCAGGGDTDLLGGPVGRAVLLRPPGADQHQPEHQRRRGGDLDDQLRRRSQRARGSHVVHVDRHPAGRQPQPLRGLRRGQQLAGGGNQLVETVSHDGMHFLPVVNANPAPTAPAAGSSTASPTMRASRGTRSWTRCPATSSSRTPTPTSSGAFVSEGKVAPGSPREPPGQLDGEPDPRRVALPGPDLR